MPNPKDDLLASGGGHAEEHSHDTHPDAAHEQGAKQEFTWDALFGHLVNHHSFSWGPLHIETPIILYDKEYGVKFYSGITAMEHEGLYTVKPILEIEEYEAKVEKLEHKLEVYKEKDPHAAEINNLKVELEAAHAKLHKYEHDAETGHHEYALVKAEEPHNPPTLDFSITGAVCYQWIAMIVLFILFGIAGSKYKKRKNKAPKGLQNLMETMVVFVRDDIVRPNAGGLHVAERLLPYFVALFFFILVMNLTGLLPGAHTATGQISVTAGLAITAYLVIQFTAIREIGIGNWFKHFLGGAPVWLFPIMFPIEVISMFVKPFALTIRLFANMTAGHVILLSLIGLVLSFQSWAMVGVAVPFSIFMYMLELLVAFLQAYIFTILTAVFVGLAIGDHDEAHAH